MAFWDADDPVVKPASVQQQEDEAAKAKAAKKAGLQAQSEANAAEKMAALEQQYATAQGAVADFDKQSALLGQSEQAERRGLRRRAAQALASMQGRAPGAGGQLAAMRQASIDRGIAEGELGASFNQQRMAMAAQRRLAEQAAAGARGTLADERQKMLLAQTTGKQQAVNAALEQARKIFEEEAGKQWLTFSDADRARTAERIRREVAEGITDQAVLAELDAFLATGMNDASGLIG